MSNVSGTFITIAPLAQAKAVHKCASCKAGGDEIEADDAVVYITGSINRGSGPRPYQGYLCESHLQSFVEDGGKISRTRKL